MQMNGEQQQVAERVQTGVHEFATAHHVGLQHACKLVLKSGFLRCDGDLLASCR
jgi:hypothetical protein